MPLGVEIGLGSGDIVLDGNPAPPQKGHSSPQFSAHVYCGQTVAHLSWRYKLLSRQQEHYLLVRAVFAFFDRTADAVRNYRRLMKVDYSGVCAVVSVPVTVLDEPERRTGE